MKSCAQVGYNETISIATLPSSHTATPESDFSECQPNLILYDMVTVLLMCEWTQQGRIQEGGRGKGQAPPPFGNYSLFSTDGYKLVHRMFIKNVLPPFTLATIIGVSTTRDTGLVYCLTT